VPNDTHVFGGGWTDEKLSILSKYLEAYTTALKDQPFRKLYIDAFAGTGRREDSAAAKAKRKALEAGQLQLSESDGADEFLDGSAAIALKSDPPFDEYIFVEMLPSRCRKLEELKRDFPARARSITILQDDANTAIQRLSAKEWKSRRAVLFLDPYGVQVKWSTIEAIAATKAIDLWVLFPLSGVNRMLTNDGEIPDTWRSKLDDLLGTNDWESELYKPDSQPQSRLPFDDLDGGDEHQRRVKQKVQVLADYFLARLNTVFPHVAKKPAILKNSRNSPLFMFCFAAGNEKGGQIALRIANHILKMEPLRHGKRLKH